MIGFPLLLLLAAVGLAGPQNAPERYDGLPLAGVQIVSPEGGVPDESLQPLLHADQGQPLNPAVVRQDLQTLYRVGAFRAVEAHVEPWIAYDASGREVPAVLLTYEVYPAPTVGRVRVEGNAAFSDAEILEMAGIAPGHGTWFPELEQGRVEEAVARALAREGWTQASVAVTATSDETGRLAITVHVEEGEPNVLDALNFTGSPDVVDSSPRHRRLRRWAARAGIKEGEPFHPDAIAAAQAEIRTALAAPPRWPRTRGGWNGARVTPALIKMPDGRTKLTFAIEPGPQLKLDVDGVPGGRREAIAVLGIDERLRLTRGWLEEAPDRMTEAIRNIGYLDATVDVELVERERRRRLLLRVTADRGARHRLRSGIYPSFLGIDFDGNEAISDADLQRVVDQASADVLKRDFFTEQELAAGLEACRLVYAARGHLDANLTLTETRQKPYGWLFPSRLIVQPIRRLFGREAPVKVLPVVTVVEGPLTTVSTVEVRGAAPGVDLAAIEAELDAMAGKAYSPQRLEQLTRRIVEAHRASGYLEVDARVEASPVEPLVRTVTIGVTPGEQVLLRSKVTRGLTRTRPSFVQREADLALGEPVTPEALERIRNNLYDLGIFRTVELDLLGDESSRDLLIDVSERARWAYELGGGISTDQGIRTFGRITRRNLWGRAHRLDLIGQIGLVYGSDNVADWLPDITQPDWRLALSYTAPRFPLRSQQLVFDLVRERRLERTWRMSRMGGGVALDWELGAFDTRRSETTLSLASRLETRQLSEIDLGALLPGEPWIEMLEDGLPSRWRVQEKLSALFLADRRDDPILPSRGFLGSATTEIAPGLPWDEWRDQPVTRFVKAETRLSSFLPLGGFVLELSGAAGHAASLDGGVVPLEDRFRLGGTGSIRGYERDAIGPRNRSSRVDIDWPDAIGPLVDYATRDDPERWVPTGGDTRASGTAELLVPLPAIGLPNWEGYAVELFADVGNVWLVSPFTQATTDQPAYRGLLPTLRVGVGTGVRVETPVGPLQVDLGVNPQAAWARDPVVRNLLELDFEEPKWRAHLTLGATF